MVHDDRLARLQERALKAEDLAERRGRMIKWLGAELAKRVGIAIRDDGEPVCFDLPPEIREGLCSKGPAGCAECWADAAEVAVTPIEYYMRDDRPGHESAEAYLERKRRESGADASAGPARARVLDFNSGLPVKEDRR